MEYAKQDPTSVESFEWQWTNLRLIDTRRNLYRRLFLKWGVWSGFYDDKTLAVIGSGGGRDVYALSQFTKAKKIYSVDLSPRVIEYQKSYIKDERVSFSNGDIARERYDADVILCIEVVQHTQDPAATIRNIIDNLADGGELFITFYMVTPATMALEPIRFVTKRLPKKVLWHVFTPLMAPIFMIKKAARFGGFRNTRLDVYDWFGGHSYQYYFTDGEVRDIFTRCGIDAENICRLDKGVYKVKKGKFPLQLDDQPMTFNA